MFRSTAPKYVIAGNVTINETLLKSESYGFSNTEVVYEVLPGTYPLKFFVGDNGDRSLIAEVQVDVLIDERMSVPPEQLPKGRKWQLSVGHLILDPKGVAEVFGKESQLNLDIPFIALENQRNKFDIDKQSPEWVASMKDYDEREHLRYLISGDYMYKGYDADRAVANHWVNIEVVRQARELGMGPFQHAQNLEITMLIADKLNIADKDVPIGLFEINDAMIADGGGIYDDELPKNVSDALIEKHSLAPTTRPGRAEQHQNMGL
jgi:hypothetical protein